MIDVVPCLSTASMKGRIAKVGAFGMNMAIDETRRNEGALGIDSLRAPSPTQ